MIGTHSRLLPVTREGPAEATDAAMHALSLASGVAIARLVTPPDAALVEEAAVFVELVRRSLAVDAATLTAAMIAAQPLIQAFADNWKLKYLIGLSLGFKLTTDGFHIRDIVEHLDSVRAERLELFGVKGGGGGQASKAARSCGAQGYTFEQLRDCELRAAAWLNCIDITQRFQSFRNALVNVALEHAQVLATLPNAQALAIPDADPPDLHVLIVDDSDITCEIHTACVRNFRQNATVHACHRSEDVKPKTHVATSPAPCLDYPVCPPKHWPRRPAPPPFACRSCASPQVARTWRAQRA